jgi:glycosyltransferase involved in cell wall biosynthesis
MTSLPGKRLPQVLHFADVVNRYDFMDNVVRNLDPKQFVGRVCTLEAESNVLSPDLWKVGIQHQVLGSGTRASYPLRVARLARVLRHDRVEILHTHHFDPGVIGWLAASAARSSTRLVVGRHYSDAIDRNSSGLKKRTLLALEAQVNRAATRIIVPSTMIRSLLLDAAVSPSKIDVIPYPFDPERFVRPGIAECELVRRDLGVDGRFVLGTFGRLYRDKGHIHLLDALSRLPPRLSDVVCLVVGDGPDRELIVRAAEERDLGGRVRMLGWRRDALRVMAAVDVVVQPSLQEGFSQAMVEALWMEKPLVATSVSGATDIIEDGERGLIVAPGDPAAIAEAIVRLHQESELGARIGRQGHAFVVRELSVDAVLPRYEEAYRRAIVGD